MKEYLQGASVERLTEIWMDTRDKDAALALIDARIEADRRPVKIKAERGAAEG